MGMLKATSIMQVRLLTEFDEAVLSPVRNPHTSLYDGEWWTTLVTISFDIDGVNINIPPGFVTNLGSVPKWARCLVDRTDQTLLAYILHDFYYSKDTIDCDRKYADRLLRRVARLCGQNRFEVWIAYTGVRVGAHSAFKKTPAVFIDVDHKLIDKICYDNGYFPDSSVVLQTMNEQVKRKFTLPPDSQ